MISSSQTLILLEFSNTKIQHSDKQGWDESIFLVQMRRFVYFGYVRNFMASSSEFLYRKVVLKVRKGKYVPNYKKSLQKFERTKLLMSTAFEVEKINSFGHKNTCSHILQYVLQPEIIFE